MHEVQLLKWYHIGWKSYHEILGWLNSKCTVPITVGYAPENENFVSHNPNTVKISAPPSNFGRAPKFKISPVVKKVSIS